MIKTVAVKLVATVIEVMDLGTLFPGSAFNGRIGLDVRIDQGSLSAETPLCLSGPGGEAVLDVVGIEMSSNSRDPNLVRILCPKPKGLSLPVGLVDGWHVAEQ
jgi:hypothetical protein